MKVVVITPTFAYAGVPLAQSRFAQALRDAGHEVTLIFCVNPSNAVVPIIPGVVTKFLGVKRIISALPKLVTVMRRLRPDVIFSAEDHLNYILLLALIIGRVPAKVSCSSRVTPYDTYSGGFVSKGAALRLLGKLVMWRATVLSCVAKDMVLQYQKILGSTRHQAIYNIIVDERSTQRMAEPCDHPWFTDSAPPVLVAAGRLAPWKGFNYLIDAFSLLVKNRDARLMILGEGPDRTVLQGQIQRLGLERYVELIGSQPNPLKYFHRSRVFVLSSTVEGMPNVLLEAIMCGCTPVAANCDTGPREILEAVLPRSLALVRDPISLCAAIEYALDNPADQQVLRDILMPFTREAVLAAHGRALGLEF